MHCTDAIYRVRTVDSIASMIAIAAGIRIAPRIIAIIATQGRILCSPAMIGMTVLISPRSPRIHHAITSSEKNETRNGIMPALSNMAISALRQLAIGIPNVNDRTPKGGGFALARQTPLPPSSVAGLQRPCDQY